MLAIKECLIREGVLNLNPPNLSTNSTNFEPTTSHYDVNTPYTLYKNRYSFGSNLNMMNMNNSLKKSATDISVNDISSSNSATAKTSCQQQQKQQPQSSQQESLQPRKLPKRYQGHHPHFHHHTAPAYYTDLHLKIHTPEAKDSVNENYQSVYRTPSKLIKDEHQFPTATAANLAAPLPLTPKTKLGPETPESVETQQQGKFFRGAYSYKDPRQHQQQNRNDPLYMPSSKKLQKPTKGNVSSSPDFIVNEDHLNSDLPQPLADGSVVFACTNFKPCVTNEAELPPQNVTPGRSRNTQRFTNRKRAVRVRSESRPISALYDIICKEKGLDIATTTTNDEDSSPSHSHDDDKAKTGHLSNRTRRSHSRSVSRQTKSSVTSNLNSNMSGSVGNNSSGGDHPQPRSALQQKKRNDKYSPNSIFINDLSDDDDDDMTHLEGGCSRKNFRQRQVHKKEGKLLDDLKQIKSSSLPPGLVNHNSHDSLNDISKKHNIKSSSNGSTAKPNSNANNHHAASQESSNPLQSSTTTTLSVDPLHMHLSSSSLQDDTGAGTNNSFSATTNNQFATNSVSSPKPAADRYSRKHRRLRDDKTRRHTDGAIKLFPSELNDFEVDDTNLQHHHRQNNDYDVGDMYSDGDDYDHQNHPSQFHDLNGAGHDFHSLTANAAANAKRYITRSQRVQQQQLSTNDSRSSPAVVNSPVLNATLQQDQQEQQQQDQQQELNAPTTVTKTTTITATAETTKPLEIKTVEETNGYTTTTIKTNGENKEQKEEMTNNSGKKSKTTTTATTTTSTKNTKDLKINHPLTTSDDITTTKTTAAPATTTTVDATCSSATDKKKDEENKQRYTSPTSPKPQQQHHYNQHKRPSSTCSDNPKYISGSETEQQHKMSSNNSSPTHRGNKKLTPSVSVSMKQNLSETQCTASRSNSLRSNANSPKSPKIKSAASSSSIECTVKITASPKVKAKSANNQKSSQHLDDDIDADFLEIHDLPDENGRPRCSTMYTDSDKSKSSQSNGCQNDKLLEVNTVHKSRTSNRSPRRNEERDKSSKRKSNLNRALNEEATPDGDDSAMRRRRRRELGMARPLVPNDDASLKALISPHKTRVPSPTKPAIRNDLSYHMEMARRGLDLATTSERRRAQTASPKNLKDSPSPKSSNPPSRISKRSDTVAIGELRKERSSVVNRKLNECTRTGLEEIMKIVENVNDSSTNPPSAINDLSQTMKRLRESQEREREMEKEAESLNLPSSSNEEHQRKPSPVKHATFVQEERIYYEPDPLEHIDNANGEGEHLKGGMLRSMRMLKAKSIERETAASEPAKLSPILRRKSTDCPPNSLTQANSTAATTNHIVSILKKKDHLSAGESSSASSNASPVTFSSNVMDTPSKQKRAGILKKRSSLDESRYYSRSHSPDERSILIKSARRNSLEEVANGSSSSSSAQGAGHHGILKQSSYDSSKSDGCPSATREPLQPHSILKKKDSTSTPSDGGDHAPKHVSISQAVILAAAELSAAVETGDKFPNDDNFTPNNEEYDIKPILKLESSTDRDDSVKPPKPILKKKSSGDSDEHEIKPILKTSRKSSREEFEFAGYSDSEIQEPPVKPILKTDSPSKRRSLGEPDGCSSQQEAEERQTLSPFQLKRRTRSLERHDQAPVIDLAAALNAIATSQALPSELVSSLTNTTAGSNISVAERIKSVEKFLANQSGGQRMSACETSAVNTSWESPLQNDPNNLSSAAGGVKILKPSVIRRDLYKDRFKTQPVTSDEKNFFKSTITSSTNDTSLPSGSAFKPAQSLEGLGFAHLSSHGNQSPNAPPSAFTLTRSFTQPLSTSLTSPPQSSSSFKTGVPVPVPRKSPPRSSLQDSVNTHNLTLSFTGDSGLSCNSNSERIFEMSSLEQDVDMAGENQEPKTPLNKDTSESSAASSSSGVVRTNSVRARANMFQQMQEKTGGNGSGAALNREERTSPKRVPRRLSPCPVVNTDEPKTPNNPPFNTDDEIEPSSLPVSERLRFFSSLSEAGSKRNSCSFTRSPPFNSIERSSSISSYHYYMATTPHSSTSLSSASVTPTPMEYPLPIFIESPTILRKNSSSSTATNEPVTANNDPTHDFTDSRFAIKPDIVKTSPFLQTTKQASAIPGHLTETETTPTSTLTPTMKRIKLKTIGKLMLPSTFLNNDRNNNNSKDSCSGNKESSSASESNGENEHTGPPKKIGKIKSPFIENCNQKQQKSVQVNTKSMKFDYNNKGQQHNSLTALSSLENSSDHHSMEITSNGLSNGVGSQRKYQNTSLQTNGHYNNEDFSTDSGKENIDTSVKEQTTPVIEIRRKFTRKANTSQSFSNSTASGTTTRQLTPRSASLNGSHSSSSPQVDNKYAKYFGLATTNKSNKSSQPPALPKQAPPTLTKSTSLTSSNNTSINVPDQFGLQTESTPQQPQVMAINPNVRLCHSSSSRGLKRQSSVRSINEVKKVKDIIVTEEELQKASKEFDKLFKDIVNEKASKEFDKLFSRIV